MRRLQNKRTKKKSRIPLLICVLALIAAAFGGIAAIAAAEAGSDKIIRNVYVDDVRIGGLKTEEAVKLLEEEFSSRKIKISLPDGRSQSFTLEELGLNYKTDAIVGEAYELGKSNSFGKNVAVICRSFFAPKRYSSSLALVSSGPGKELLDFAEGYKAQPTESAFEILEDRVVITNGMNGYEVDVDKLIETVTGGEEFPQNLDAPINVLPFTLPDIDEIYNKAASDPRAPYARNNDGKITATVKNFNLDIARSIQKENSGEGDVYEFIMDSESVAPLGDESLYPEVMGECTTQFSTGNAPRAANIRLAASVINGRDLLPGEEFSFNEINGESTTDKGYQVSKGYSGTQVVDSVGGGICQVTGTIYTAALYAGLEITERTNHSMPVSYLPMGQDSTISYPRLDLRFKNSFDIPVKLFAFTDGGSITVQIRGRKSDKFDEVKIENTTLSVLEPSEKEVSDESLSPGQRVVTQKGAKGYVVETVRVYYKDGVPVKRENLGKSTYKAQEKIVKVGIEKNEQAE